MPAIAGVAIIGVIGASGLPSSAATNTEPKVQLQSIDVGLGTDASIDSLSATDYVVDLGKRKEKKSSEKLNPETAASNLPISVGVVYKAGNKIGTDLADLKGVSGPVELDITVTNRTARPERVKVGDAAFGAVSDADTQVFEPLTVIGTAVMPAKKLNRIDEDTNGNVSRRGGDVTIQWGALLAPPALGAAATFRLVVDAKDFELDSFGLSVERGEHNDFSLDRIVDQLFGTARQDDIASAVKRSSDISNGLGEIQNALNVIYGALTRVTTERSSELISTLSGALTSLKAQAEALEQKVGDQSKKVEVDTASATDNADRVLEGALSQLLKSLGTDTANPPESSVRGAVKKLISSVGKQDDSAATDSIIGKLRLALGTPPAADFVQFTPGAEGAKGSYGITEGTGCGDAASVQCKLDAAFHAVNSDLRTAIDTLAGQINAELLGIQTLVMGADGSTSNDVAGAQTAMTAALTALGEASTATDTLGSNISGRKTGTANVLNTELKNSKTQLTDALASLAALKSSLEVAKASLASGAVKTDMTALGAAIIAANDNSLAKQTQTIRNRVGQISDSVCGLSSGVADNDSLVQKLSNLRFDLTAQECTDPDTDDTVAANAGVDAASSLKTKLLAVQDGLDTASDTFVHLQGTALPAVETAVNNAISALDASVSTSVAGVLTSALTNVNDAINAIKGGVDTTADTAAITAKLADAKSATDTGIQRTKDLINSTFAPAIAGAETKLGVDATTTDSACGAETTAFAKAYAAIRSMLGCSSDKLGTDDEIAAAIDDKLKQIAKSLVDETDLLNENTNKVTDAIAKDTTDEFAETSKQLARLRDDVKRSMDDLRTTTGKSTTETKDQLAKDVATAFKALTGSESATAGASIQSARGGFQRDLVLQLAAMQKETTNAGNQNQSLLNFKGLRQQALFAHQVRTKAQQRGEEIANMPQLFHGRLGNGSTAATIFQYHFPKIG